MISVVLIGFGTIGKHLFTAFLKAKNINVVQIYNRSKLPLNTIKGIETTTDLNSLIEADVYIIATKDDAIKKVSKSLATTNKLVAHTSGSVGLENLSKLNRNGSFYPLQTFSKNKSIDFKTVPICIEAENKTDLDLLQKLASEISNNVQEVSSEQRKSIHLAAVFVNNFTNHMFYIGKEICTKNNLPFSILSPLIKETINKLDSLQPLDAQTGPAKRGDKETMKRHLAQLQQETFKKIYSTISNSITDTYGKKL